MDIVQIINTGNQVFNAAGMSVSGISTDLETSRVVLTKGIMAGGFILQQKRGIYFFFAMMIAAIFRSIKTFSQSGPSLNDARFFKFLKSIKSGFGRLIERLGFGKPELVVRHKSPDQDTFRPVRNLMLSGNIYALFIIRMLLNLDGRDRFSFLQSN